MRAKKSGICISLLVVLICLISIMSIKDNELTIKNVLIGILGSAIVTFAIYSTEYYVDRKCAYEDFLQEADKIAKEFQKLEFFKVEKVKTQLIVNYLNEQCENGFNKRLGKRLKNDAKNDLYQHYLENYMRTDPNNKKNRELARTEMNFQVESCKRKLMSVINSFYLLANLSTFDIEQAYGNIVLFYPYRRNGMYKLLEGLYDYIKVEIEKVKGYILWLKKASEAEVLDLGAFIVYICDIQDSLFMFEHGKQSNSEFNVDFVISRVSSTIYERNEGIRAKLYKKKPSHINSPRIDYIVRKKNEEQMTAAQGITGGKTILMKSAISKE